VSVPGSYDISATENGVTFSARGNFTSIGNHDIVLHATGTPVATGSHTFALNTSPNSCSFSRMTDSNIGVVASYNCNAPHTGNLTVGVPVTGVTQTIIVDVTTVGIYSIQASANGVTFAATGTFLATGSQNIVLTATGTPLAIGSNNFILNTTPNCSFIRITTDATSVVGGTGRIWMAYNLGATAPATAINDATQFGDFYQWGRGTDGHEKRNSARTSTQSAGDSPGHGRFITTSSDWRLTTNNNLWKGITGTNNPCPSGYRIPTSQEWISEFRALGITDQTSAFNSVLKLPLPGYRSIDFAHYTSSGTSGFYWTSDTNGTQTTIINTSTAITFNGDKGWGHSVRCIKD
ncbi:major paralogous domain-containing protein, partial [Flavobacterium hercynium]